MCKLLFPQSKHSWWCVHPSCFLLKSPTSLFVIQCIATIFIFKLGTILVATFISDHTQDFLFKKILLTWAACITSHCIWWHLQSKTLTFRQLENSPFGIRTFTTISKTSFVVSNSFLRIIFLTIDLLKMFLSIVIYTTISETCLNTFQSNHRSVWTFWGVSKVPCKDEIWWQEVVETSKETSLQ